MKVVSQIKSDIFHLFLKLSPVKKKKILFNNYCGKGYGDSPKYIADEILRRNAGCDIVWMVDNINDELPKGVRPVLTNTKRAAYELATAKVLVCNVKQALVFRKKKKQYYIQTWHGSFGLKYIEKDAEDKLEKKYLLKTIADSKRIDLLLSSSNWQTEEYKRAFWYDGEILEKGFPRNDILFNMTEQKAKQIKEELGIPHNKKILLYAPTFRNNLSLDAYDIDLSAVKKELENKTYEEWIILVRLHPNFTSYSDLFKGIDYIDATAYPDGQEILAISDILISDYSSNMIDFILMNKPVIRYASDIKEYKEERGLKPVYFDLPFPLSQNNKELIDIVRKFEMATYQENLKEFRKKYIEFDDGHASENVVDIILSKIK